MEPIPNQLEVAAALAGPGEEDDTPPPSAFEAESVAASDNGESEGPSAPSVGSPSSIVAGMAVEELK